MNRKIAKQRSRAKRTYGKNCFSERKRLLVLRSNQHITALLIDNVNGDVLVSVSTNSKTLRAEKGTKSDKAFIVGKLLAEQAKSKGIDLEVFFDRRGNPYHGRIKRVADGAREGGLLF